MVWYVCVCVCVCVCVHRTLVWHCWPFGLTFAGRDQQCHNIYSLVPELLILSLGYKKIVYPGGEHCLAYIHLQGGISTSIGVIWLDVYLAKVDTGISSAFPRPNFLCSWNI